LIETWLKWHEVVYQELDGGAGLLSYRVVVIMHQWKHKGCLLGEELAFVLDSIEALVDVFDRLENLHADLFRVLVEKLARLTFDLLARALIVFFESAEDLGEMGKVIEAAQ